MNYANHISKILNTPESDLDEVAANHSLSFFSKYFEGEKDIQGIIDKLHPDIEKRMSKNIYCSVCTNSKDTCKCREGLQTLDKSLTTPFTVTTEAEVYEETTPKPKEQKLIDVTVEESASGTPDDSSDDEDGEEVPGASINEDSSDDNLEFPIPALSKPSQSASIDLESSGLCPSLLRFQEDLFGESREDVARGDKNLGLDEKEEGRAKCDTSSDKTIEQNLSTYGILEEALKRGIREPERMLSENTTLNMLSAQVCMAHDSIKVLLMKLDDKTSDDMSNLTMYLNRTDDALKVITTAVGQHTDAINSLNNKLSEITVTLKTLSSQMNIVSSVASSSKRDDEKVLIDHASGVNIDYQNMEHYVSSILDSAYLKYIKKPDIASFYTALMGSEKDFRFWINSTIQCEKVFKQYGNLRKAWNLPECEKIMKYIFATIANLRCTEERKMEELRKRKEPSKGVPSGRSVYYDDLEKIRRDVSRSGSTSDLSERGSQPPKKVFDISKY